MKRNIIAIMMVMVALLATQCKKSAEPLANEPAGETMEVTVRVENNTAKTDITATGVVTWKQGDKLYVVGETQGLLGYVSAVADGDPVQFEGEITALTSAQVLRFYYVGDKDFTLDGSNYTFNLGSQDGTLAGIAAHSQLMFGKTSEGVAVGTTNFGTITMTSLMSIAHLNINDGGAAVSGPVAVTGGLATSTFNAKTYNGTTPLTGTEGNITMTFAEGTASTNCYLALLPGTQTLKFIEAGGGKVATLAEKAVVPNMFYNSSTAIPVNVTEAIKPSEVTVTASCSNEDIYTLGGSVTVPDGIHTCEFGLVYSETDNTPTIEEGAQKVKVGTATFSGTQSFTADITGLTVGTTYHVRAYAMIDGVTYSTGVKDIVGGDGPQTMTWTGGKSPKKFTVASGKQVYFSQGNLQYMGSTGTWKFADHQFDFIGNGQNDSDASNIDRDLFGWGTSGYHQSTDSYNVNYQPWATSTSIVNPPSNYYGYGPSTNVTPGGPFGMTQSAGNISGSYYDWGVNCAISNGGGSSWRTLTKDEWVYLIDTRKDGSDNLLYGEGKVGSCTPGLIILPDDWSCPSGLTDVVRGTSSWSNVYSYSDWAKMEAAGAVFLPAAGYRNDTSVDGVGSEGNYWSSSYRDSGSAYYLYFDSGDVVPDYDIHRYYGFSVRLVSDN